MKLLLCDIVLLLKSLSITKIIVIYLPWIYINLTILILLLNGSENNSL
jgi:hypothetical protein